MLVTFKHDGTGYRAPEEPGEVSVDVRAAAHTYHSGQRQKGRNWLVWPLDHHDAPGGPVHADTFAEAVFAAAGIAADYLGGVVLATVAGVEVPPEWDAVALLTESWQSDPPFSDWPEVLDGARRGHPCHFCGTVPARSSPSTMGGSGETVALCPDCAYWNS